MTTKLSERNVAIVGAGLAGTLMAMYLARRGWRVDIYERRTDPRLTRIHSGRSINMTLAIRGLAALSEVLELKKILELTMPVEGRMVHEEDGSLKFYPYGVNKTEIIYAIQRSALNMRLIDIAESSFPNIKVRFNHRCNMIDLKNWSVDIYDENSQEHKFINPDFVIGADGTFSAVRQQIQKNEYANFRQEYLENGFKELVFAAGPNNSFQMAANVLHLWPRGRSMLMAIPNLDGTFASNCVLPFGGPEGFGRLDTPARVMEFFQDKFPDAIGLIEGLPHSFLRNPPAGFPSTWADPWHSSGRVVLIGDACHTVVPFYGLGMNAAFEDCFVLDQCIEKHSGNLGLAFSEYQHLRKTNTDALADLSLQNFVELRDKVRSTRLSARKKVFNVLHKMFPKAIVPLYTMMTHTTMPMAEALRRAKAQDRWARWLGIDIVISLVAAFQLCARLFKKTSTLRPKPAASVPATYEISSSATQAQEPVPQKVARQKTASY